MVEYKEDKINYIILNMDEKFELLIRAEKNIKEKGLVIVKKSMDDINNIIKDIKDLNYFETIKYLKQYLIGYKEIRYM